MKQTFVFLLLILTTQSGQADYITNDITGGCDSQTLQTINNTTYLEPIFVVTEYNCSAGTFLPANTMSCQPCPSGYTCAGGTFEFNETYAQGITPKDTLSTDAQFACSSNVLKTVGNTTYLEPIFTPKTIALTYDDGVGNTSSGTCTYDGLINLPETPVRPGYTFTGWKLQTNNE